LKGWGLGVYSGNSLLADLQSRCVLVFLYITDQTTIFSLRQDDVIIIRWDEGAGPKSSSTRQVKAVVFI
jgi:hypothetical protein